MSEFGEMLRKAREKKGVSLAQVEEITRIRQKFLRALEEGERDSLPEEVYVRAFLRSYARYLDLNPDEVIGLYSGREETPVQEVPPPKPLPTAFRPLDLSLLPTPWLSPRWAIAIAAAIMSFALLTACGIWVVRRYFISETPSKVIELATPTLEASMRSDTSTPEIGTESLPTPSLIPSSPTATSTSTPTPTITPTPTPKVYTGIEIEMIIHERAWLRVVVDGVKEFEGIFEAGEKRIWSGEEWVTVRCGNAGGVEVIVNGQSIGLLGESGQVIDLEWRKEGGTPPPAEAPTEIPPSPTGEAAGEPTAVP